MRGATRSSFARRLLAAMALFAVVAGAVWIVWVYPRTLLTIILLAAYSPLMMGLLPGVWIRDGEELPVAATDLPRRRPVWNALSELYLDTELDEADKGRIAATLAESGYSAGQLEEILYRELHPLLLTNLFSVAGEWAGFDPNWLEEQILLRPPNRSCFAIITGKWMVRKEWASLEAKVRTARLEAAQPPRLAAGQGRHW